MLNLCLQKAGANFPIIEWKDLENCIQKILISKDKIQSVKSALG